MQDAKTLCIETALMMS